MLLAATIALPLLAALIVAALPRRDNALATGVAVGAAIATAILALVSAGTTMTGVDLDTTIAAVPVQLETTALGAILQMLTAVLAALAVCAAPPPEAGTRRWLQLVLFLDGALLALFAAPDATTFGVLWLLAAATGWTLVRAARSADSGAGSTGDFLFVVGPPALWLTLAVVRPTALPATGTLALALAVHTPIFPFHGWAARIARGPHAAVELLVGGALLKVGAYGLLCFGVADGTALVLLAALGCAAAGLAAAAAVDLRRVTVLCGLSQTALAAAGVLSGTIDGAAGGAVLLVGAALWTPALLAVARAMATRGLSLHEGEAGRAGRTMPRTSVVATFLALAAVGVAPGIAVAGFGRVLPELWGAGAMAGCAATFGLLASAGALLTAWGRVLFGAPPRRPDGPPLTTRSTRDLDVAEMLALLPLVLLFLLLAFFPFVVTDAVISLAE